MESNHYTGDEGRPGDYYQYGDNSVSRYAILLEDDLGVRHPTSRPIRADILGTSHR